MGAIVSYGGLEVFYFADLEYITVRSNKLTICLI